MPKNKRLIDSLRTRKFERSASIISDAINTETRTISFIIVSNQNAGDRFDWWEGQAFIEEIDPNGADTSRLRTFFTDHNPTSLNAIGRITNIRLDTDGQIKCDVVFGTSTMANEIFTRYVEGILTDVSIGYNIDDVVETEKKGEPTHVMVTRFTILELSSVWSGFDSGATVGRSKQSGVSHVETINDPDVIEREIEILKRKVQ